ncbi:uncharacterized protein LOC106417567 isoform X2 [Brassica napus]|uniref:uncharacterized protein LOC106417567 isoform X2 n=1 Tax=Brassica napus TaxID=3708 RepID=UPI00207ACBA4|nr:uncharacterized protein LOC106417567 isoform X2 [Brassica napus]
MECLDANFPVCHRKVSLEIKGNKTEIVICSYDDHILVIATQIGAMGTILHARKEEGMSVEPTFSVSVIFGKRDEVTKSYHILARLYRIYALLMPTVCS